MGENTNSREWLLNREEVHVWLAALNGLVPRMEEYHSFLTADEQAKAARFHFQKDREHYTLARGILRVLLARFLGMAPQEVRFCYNEYGKPALETEQKRGGLEFNLSHSHGLALYGFTLGRSIGVDVEKIRSNIETEQLAQRFFAPAEVAALNGLPEDKRLKAFFTGWVRKEAFIKARGMGFSLALDKFAVSLIEGSPALLSLENDRTTAERWMIHEVPTPNGFVAAIVVEGPVGGLKFRVF